MSNDPIKRRQYILNQLILIAGSWEATGEQDKGLEQQFESKLAELHPVRKNALDILYRHLAMEVAA
ncbi:hypothetical protein B0H99_101404 [Planomicrobium soli]|uniref:Uncharacterized protein n=1 Tax=Planomicrobium soli TaxID=1176648 RepID=A0A2P8H7G3_9BACL|nr:hypothetical protein [Planomicrobium soli]PSL42156.1 hypothetical protein B0H99_101404 [Planomicrobium soli]